MKGHHVIRALWAGVVVAALIATAAPAAGQAGSIARIRGRVVDEKSQPVADVEITIQSVGGDQQNEYKVKTGRDGVFQHAGVYAGSGAGVYTIVARKGDLEGEMRGVAVKGGIVNPIPDIIMTAAVGGPTTPGGARMTAAEIADFNRKQEELKQLYEGVNADIDAKNYDGAIAKLQAIIEGRKDCANCYAALGGVYLRKGDLPNAEKAHLEAIKLDPKLAASYDDLGTIYNQQRKFAEAAKMTTTAMELNQAAAASAGAAGGSAPTGNDAKSLYNQGVILWNQTGADPKKIPQARAYFERAVKLDPKYANAQYQLGLALYSEGKMAESKGPLEEYLKLAPSGENAATAKAILATIK
jgi:Flp pilus assembly protein TadD